MARNVLLTSLSATERNLPVRFFSVRNEFGFSYCDALLDAEASIKAALARFNIDEIIVLGGTGSYDSQDDLSPVSLSHGRALYSADVASLSTYGLLQRQVARYADELPLDQKAEDGRLSEEAQEKLIRFIRDFEKNDAELKNQKPNRLFDALAQNNQLCERLWASLFEACPELREKSEPCKRWVKCHLYSEMKPSAKLELLPLNEGVSIRLIPADLAEDEGEMVDSMMAMKNSIVEEQTDINLYVSLNSDDAADTFNVMNMLDILVSAPDSDVHLKKIFTVRIARGQLTGVISDDTSGFGVTELIHATRSFLTYGKADLIVDIWEKGGVRNESISGMVYAMRHVDVGLSLCNIPEMEEGILYLRKLFRDEKVWRDFGYYGMLFSVIANSIREDYGALLEGDGDIPFIDLVKWAYRHQFYQQTLTLIESKAPENLVKSGIFYYCDDEKNAEHVTQLFAKKRLELKPYEYYKMDKIEHYFIKTYDRVKIRGMGGRGDDPQRLYATLRTQSVDNDDPTLVTGFTACDNRETLQNLLFAYYHIGDVRNAISHADAGSISNGRLIVSESDESAALLRTKDSVEYFINNYEKAMAEVQGKNPNVVLISADDVRKVAGYMKFDKRKDD